MTFDMIKVCPLSCLYFINNEKQNTYLTEDKYVIRYFNILQFQQALQQYFTTDNFNSRSALDPVIEYNTYKASCQLQTNT